MEYFAILSGKQISVCKESFDMIKSTNIKLYGKAYVMADDWRNPKYVTVLDTETVREAR